MEDLIDTIRTAVANDATTEARAAGAQACRTILAALEAKPGAPLAAPTPHAPTALHATIAALRGIPVDQLLDVAIAKLTSMLPAQTETPSVQALRVPLVAVPTQLVKGGASS